MGMKTVGDKMHSYDSNCIYSVENLMGTLSSSLCQSLNKEAVGFIPAWSLAFLQGKGKRQVLSMMERIYSRVRYLGRKGEFGECKRSN